MNMCQAGHQACAPCYTSLPLPKHRPECRGLYMTKGARMAKHMAECRDRMVPCPYLGCNRRTLFNNVSEHMKVLHGRDGVRAALTVVISMQLPLPLPSPDIASRRSPHAKLLRGSVYQLRTCHATARS